MAIYHCSISVISRSAGQSAVAAAAYRAAVRLEYDRIGSVFDYRAKSGVRHRKLRPRNQSCSTLGG
ncbi:MAG: MobA/MobL family protein [Holosporaceae bacterium]